MMTNYDRIKAMSIEDMVRFIRDYVFGVCGCCIFSENENCYDNEDKCKFGIKQWLESEVEE